MQDDPRYDDVVSEVRDALVARAEQAVAAWVREVWIDPGIGFGKTLDHNLELLAHLDAFVATGYPVAIGTSRKGLIGRLTALSDRCARSRRPALPALPVLPGEAAAAVEEAAAAVEERLEGSLATATWAMALGAGLVRAHDVGPTVHAALVVGGRIAA